MKYFRPGFPPVFTGEDAALQAPATPAPTKPQEKPFLSVIDAMRQAEARQAAADAQSKPADPPRAATEGDIGKPAPTPAPEPPKPVPTEVLPVQTPAQTPLVQSSPGVPIPPRELTPVPSERKPPRDVHDLHDEELQQ